MNTTCCVNGDLFAKAHTLLRESVRTTLSKHKLTPTSWHFVSAIAYTKGGVRMGSLAKKLNVKAPLVTVMSRQFIERGWIKMTSGDPDRRAKSLIMTPQGTAVIRNIEADLQEVLGSLLVGLTEEEMQTYRHVLETIVENGRIAQAVATPDKI